MPSLRSPLLRLLVPLAAALLLVRLESYLSAWIRSRPGLLVVAMVVLLGGLLLSHIRQLLIVALCFGISLLALGDVFQAKPPPPLDYVVIARLYPFGWALLALLAAGAGVGEALKPGSVWARRCYFGAAALYLSARGVNGLLRSTNWESLVLLGTGLAAWIGVLFANRIVAAEMEAMEEDDLACQTRAEAERRAATIAAREWREKPEEMPKAPPQSTGC